MHTFTKVITNVLFSTLLIVFFAFMVVKLSCCKISQTKKNIINIAVEYSKIASNELWNWLTETVNHQHRLLVALRHPSFGDLYSDISEKVHLIKGKTHRS